MSQPGQWLARSEKEECQRNICEILLSSSSRQLGLISHCIQCSEVILTLFLQILLLHSCVEKKRGVVTHSHARMRQGSGINWLQCYGALLGSYLRAVCTYSNFPFLNTAKKNRQAVCACKLNYTKVELEAHTVLWFIQHYSGPKQVCSTLSSISHLCQEDNVCILIQRQKIIAVISKLICDTPKTASVCLTDTTNAG